TPRGDDAAAAKACAVWLDDAVMLPHDNAPLGAALARLARNGLDDVAGNVAVPVTSDAAAA
ncbi:hypothetical protein, partial [Streptococcus pneumoniae]|uniref:hypothetical protein n=1 Tax=Streptococcus pneumoniae TaxID=1313 RepID=UPI0018B070F7